MKLLIEIGLSVEFTAQNALLTVCLKQFRFFSIALLCMLAHVAQIARISAGVVSLSD